MSTSPFQSLGTKRSYFSTLVLAVSSPSQPPMSQQNECGVETPSCSKHPDLITLSEYLQNRRYTSTANKHYRLFPPNPIIIVYRIAPSPTDSILHLVSHYAYCSSIRARLRNPFAVGESSGNPTSMCHHHTHNQTHDTPTMIPRSIP